MTLLVLLLLMQVDHEARIRRLEALHEINVCGNGVLEADFQESCDGSDLAGQTCQSFGFDQGILACAASCELDTSGCFNTPPPPTTALAAPYYETPPGDLLVLQHCGPESEWEQWEVRTDEDAAAVRGRVRSDTRAVIRVYPKSPPYGYITAKGGKCIKVVGVSEGGAKPLVAAVNATWSLDAPALGGLIVENLEISPGKVVRARPELNLTVSECIGVPSDQAFLIIRNSEVTRCGHHGFTTSHAHNLYVEVGNSYFTQASSHLAYINHNAMAYIYDSRFESPGWGTALRCIALRCILDNVEVSNIQFDGTVLPVGGDNPYQPGRVYIGEAPLEVYTCGAHEVTDTRVTFYKQQGKTGAHAVAYRWREGMNTCDTGEVVGGQWSDLPWSLNPPFGDPARWGTVDELVTTIDRLTVNVVGSEVDSSFSFDIDGTYPMMNDPEKIALKNWLKSHVFVGWNDLLTQIQATGNQLWIFAANQSLENHRDSFMRGSITNKVPLPIPLAGWKQRSRVVISNLTSNAPQLHVPFDLDGTGQYCLGTPPVAGACTEQVDGRRFRYAFVEVR